MKKLVVMLIFLFIFYLGLQFIFTYFGKGENYSYKIVKNDLLIGVDEKSTFKIGSSKDNYYYKILVNNKEFSFQVNHNFSKRTQLIADIEYFKNKDYECILPIFKDGLVLTDVICYTNFETTYYHNLVGKSVDLDRFVNGIEIYDVSKFQDNEKSEIIEGIYVYSDNLIENHYIGFTNYRGIFNISKNFNSRVYNIALYKNDERNQKLGIFYEGYYISADYNQNYEFNKFNLVDLIKLNTSTFASDIEISFDSYIQGIVDGEIYLYDKDHKNQYIINIEKQTISKINSDEISYYNNGLWTTISGAEANLELKFINNKIDYENERYIKIDKVGNETGYYYLYLKHENKYKVYRMNIQDKFAAVYLFETESINNMFYVDDCVYFISGNYIKVYSDSFGVKRLIQYNELEFNKNINFSVYKK